MLRNCPEDLGALLFGAPKGGCFDQGLFSNVVFVFFVVPQNTGIYGIQKGLFSKFCLMGPWLSWFRG